MASSFDPQEFDDVEIVISRATDGSGYMAHIRLLDVEPAFNKLPPPPFENLDGASNPLTYGEQLFQWLFRDEVGKVFSYARQLASEPTRGFKSGTRLRLRLSLDSGSSELRQLCWESLYTLEGHLPFSLTTAFSRFIRTSGLRGGPFRERPLRMLLAISNPKGIDGSTLDVVDPDLEKSIIKDATRSSGPLLKLDRLQGPPTLARIQAAVEKGYHIVHLLAPAVVHNEQGYLVLSDDAGRAQEVSVEALVRTIVSPSQSLPALVFLGVPLTTRKQDDGTLVNLAQMLIEAGVQALVAIRSPIGESNLRRFIERFYAALMRTGVIDVAIREARTEIYRPDNWEWTYPVLYMRIPDGQLFQPLPETLESTVTGIRIDSI
jgi:hypothetical protein